MATKNKEGRIRAGIGGWTYAPWRGMFYPKGLQHARELNHASRQVTAIEINGTFIARKNPRVSRSGATRRRTASCFR